MSLISTDDHRSGLRVALEEAMEQEGASMKDLTVLAAQRDPYRVDTPAGHRDGAWLAEQAEPVLAELLAKLNIETIHLRGLHYAVIGRTCPASHRRRARAVGLSAVATMMLR